jgi:hypothetical protein
LIIWSDSCIIRLNKGGDNHYANFLKPSEVLEDTERLGEIINEASERVLKYCNKQLFGEAIYYWMDEKNIVRGHGKTEEECRI